MLRHLLFGLTIWATAGAVCLAEQPNVLWITSEDNGPHLGCYGDPDANTPHLDGLAHRGAIYLNCWSNAPVCAPARTSIITGISPTSLGAEHMRSQVPLPRGMRLFPELLREAGYYCTNNSKEDYNVDQPGKTWDQSNNKAHWRNRKPGQPFFAVFNFTTTHESQIRSRPHRQVHDPRTIHIPAFHPDIPEVRQEWAQYHDKMTEMDAQVGDLLGQLEQDGLTDDTIIFYYGDHGPGLPRCKRTPCNSGLRVPLIVVIPPKYADLAVQGFMPGAKLSRLVSFIDLAPTVLSLAGVDVPERMQGTAFLGPHTGPEPQYLYGFRGRMDERYDTVRSVRDRRFVYVRNFWPHLPAGQHNTYMFLTPMTRAWKAAFDAGQLSPAQARYWEPRAPEELYDLERDPDEVVNLASNPEYADTLQRLRGACQNWITHVHDVGLLPEPEMHRRAQGRPLYEFGLSKDYPVVEILAAADAATLDPGSSPVPLGDGLKHSDSGVRYWSALGLLIRGQAGFDAGASDLEKLLQDPSPAVQIVAAEIIVRWGPPEKALSSLELLAKLADVSTQDFLTAVMALNALDNLGDRSRPVYETLRSQPIRDPQVNKRMQDYVERLHDKILGTTKS